MKGDTLRDRRGKEVERAHGSDHDMLRRTEYQHELSYFME